MASNPPKRTFQNRWQVLVDGSQVKPPQQPPVQLRDCPRKMSSLIAQRSKLFAGKSKAGEAAAALAVTAALLIQGCAGCRRGRGRRRGRSRGGRRRGGGRRAA